MNLRQSISTTGALAQYWRGSFFPFAQPLELQAFERAPVKTPDCRTTAATGALRQCSSHPLGDWTTGAPAHTEPKEAELKKLETTKRRAKPAVKAEGPQDGAFLGNPLDVANTVATPDHFWPPKWSGFWTRDGKAVAFSALTADEVKEVCGYRPEPGAHSTSWAVGFAGDWPPERGSCFPSYQETFEPRDDEGAELAHAACWTDGELSSHVLFLSASHNRPDRDLAVELIEQSFAPKLEAESDGPPDLGASFSDCHVVTPGNDALSGSQAQNTFNRIWTAPASRYDDAMQARWGGRYDPPAPAPKPEQSGWVCHLFGHPGGVAYAPIKGQLPNAFWRFMQRLVFGFRWVGGKEAADYLATLNSGLTIEFSADSGVEVHAFDTSHFHRGGPDIQFPDTPTQ